MNSGLSYICVCVGFFQSWLFSIYEWRNHFTVCLTLWSLKMQPKCFPDKRANDCAGRRMTTVLIGHVHEGAGLETDCWTSLREMMMMIIKRQREKRHIQPKRSKQKKREKKNGQFNQKWMKIKFLFTLMLFQTYGSLFPPNNLKILKVIESF